jgi:hypothetical protein
MVEFQGQPVEKMVLPQAQYNRLISHCLRKLEEDYLEDEAPERKAYGLLGGRLDNTRLKIESVALLKRNVRAVQPHKAYMDELLGRFAMPSETPLHRRGWVADPLESRNILLDFSRDGLELVGTYHMHRVGWENDPIRDTPTELDTILAEGSEVFQVIVSTVDPEKPIVRAFYEGIPDQEIPINLV